MSKEGYTDWVIELDEETYKDLRKIAKKLGISIGETVKRVLMFGLNHNVK